MEQQLQVDPTFSAGRIVDEDWPARVEDIVREFAKLDGYDVLLRSLRVTEQPEPAPEIKSWSAPVRVVLEQPDWKTSDGAIQGSHDAGGTVRPEYLEDDTIYSGDWTIKSEFLSPDCIEANDLNLSAARYKPVTVTIEAYEPPANIVREVQHLEAKIQQELATLLGMLEREE